MTATSMTTIQTNNSRFNSSYIQVIEPCTEHIFSEKQYLGKWCLDLSSFGVFKGSRMCPTSSDYIIDDCDLGLGNTLRIFTRPISGYGQDVRGITSIQYNRETLCPQQLILFNNDGHGAGMPGYMCALEVCKILSESLIKNSNHIFKDLFKVKGNFKLNRKLINYMFHDCDKKILEKYGEGGTTSTIKWFVLCPKTGKLHVFDIMLGDSPSVKINLKDNTVKELCFTQNCDTQEAIDQWLNVSYKLNEKPPRAILSRFNSGRFGTKTLDYMTDEKGRVKMIDLFDYKQKDGKWYTETSNTLKEFYKISPPSVISIFRSGGCQSLRDKLRCKMEYLKGGFPMCNYGNTIEGMGQNLGSFGDIRDKFNHRVHTKPNIHHEVLTEPNRDIYFLGSDGVFDILTDDSIITACNKIDNPENSSEDYLVAIIKRGYSAAMDNNWKFKKGLGTWDDQSCWCITISSGNTVGSKNDGVKFGRHKKANLKKRRKRDARKRYKNRHKKHN